MGNRLRTIRLAKKLTLQGAADALGVSYGQYVKLERGERRLSDIYIDRAAKGFGVAPAEVIDETGSVRLPIVGRVGASTDGAILHDTDHGPFGEIEATAGAMGTEVAVEVVGHSMGLYAPDGSLILYDNRHTPPHDGLLGHMCIVGLPDGRTLVKKLLRGSRRGLFDLESAIGDTLRDQQVAWAAEVLVVVHPRHARRIRID